MYLQWLSFILIRILEFNTNSNIPRLEKQDETDEYQLKLDEYVKCMFVHKTS